MDNKCGSRDIFNFQVQRMVTSLFKEYLKMMERLTLEHDIAIKKLKIALPEEQKKDVDLADYLSDEKLQEIRKDILSRGNECWRDIVKYSENFNIDFK